MSNINLGKKGKELIASKLWKLECSIKDSLDDKRVQYRQKSIENRIKEKWKYGKKINVVFVCHRPQIWGALNSVYEAFRKDDNFKVTIVAIPNKKEDPVKYFYHEEYISENAEVYFRSLEWGADVVDGYDYERKVWLDLKELKPDYIFFQTPYNICRPPQYNSKKVAQYAKLCYIHYSYGNMDFQSLGTSPLDFMKHVSLLFPDTREKEKLWNSLLRDVRLIKNRGCYYCGYPKFDKYIDLKSKCEDPWHLNKKMRILWTPRWTEEENNSHYKEYKDNMLNYARCNPDVEVWFRPHPQMKENMKEDHEWKKYLQEIEKTENYFIDFRDEYFDTFIYSDILISDISGMMAEYMPTKKPIILCARAINFNQTGRKLAEGYYWVHSWEELLKTINMIKEGQDLLYDKRCELILSELIGSNEKSIGSRIKDIVSSSYKNY